MQRNTLPPIWSKTFGFCHLGMMPQLTEHSGTLRNTLGTPPGNPWNTPGTPCSISSEPPLTDQERTNICTHLGSSVQVALACLPGCSCLPWSDGSTHFARVGSSGGGGDSDPRPRPRWRQKRSNPGDPPIKNPPPPGPHGEPSSSTIRTGLSQTGAKWCSTDGFD